MIPHASQATAHVNRKSSPLAIVESGSLSNECRSSQMAGGIAASIAIGNICVDIYNGAGSATIRDILSALTGGLPC